MAMDIHELLEESDFFRALSLTARGAIASICVPKVLRKREILFLEGDQGHSMYLLAQGTVQLFKSSVDGKEVVIKLLRPGEIFGEVVLFEQDRFPVSACALTPAQVFMIPKKQLDCLLQEQAFRRDFIAMLLSKQRYLAERIFRLSALDVEQRFFHFLREQYGEREEYAIDITKRDFAAAIDALPETLSRLLLKLRDDGTVQWDGERLQVRAGFWKQRRAPGVQRTEAG
jgi:CRP/FNR family transcriptional regulator, dissimilatory nitrate respiration regulator